MSISPIQSTESQSFLPSPWVMLKTVVAVAVGSLMILDHSAPTRSLRGSVVCAPASQSLLDLQCKFIFETELCPDKENCLSSPKTFVAKWESGNSLFSCTNKGAERSAWLEPVVVCAEMSKQKASSSEITCLAEEFSEAVNEDGKLCAEFFV